MSRRLLASNVFISGLILAQAILVQSNQFPPRTPYDPESDSHDYDPEKVEKEDKFSGINEKNPSMYCLLFGGNACSIVCYLTGQVYNTVTSGSCDENQTCHCHLYIDFSFHNNWYSKFNADYVYRQIILRPPDSNEIYDLVLYPLRTSEELKHLIKPLISPYQFSILETRDNTPAATFVNENGRYNKKSVQDYVVRELDIIAQQAPQFYLNFQYKDRFREVLRTASAATLYNLTFKVRQLENEILYDILKKHLEERKIAEPEVQLYEITALDEILDNFIMTEII